MPIVPLPPLLLLFILLPFHVISQPTTTQNDQTTLLNLKHFWSNPPSLSHWNQSSDPCGWPEIICNATTITGIDLLDKNIHGTVPWIICDLKSLTHLNLNFNNLTGAFPKALYNCTNLQYLDLSQNFFVGRIPDDISRLSPELRFLNLFGNNFTGDIPISISRLSKLSSLQLHENLFNGSFPEEIGYLNDLEELNLAYNGFKPSRLPPAFTRLKKLRKLYMAGANLIGEIPRNLSSMVALELLDLSVNQINGSIPSDLFMLKNLTEVYLYNNKFSGELPPKLGPELRTLDISNNKFSGELADGPELQMLDISNNKFSGQIPTAISSWTNLTFFKASNNLLDGAIPQELTALMHLQTLLLDGNKFTGELPATIISWSSLHTLNLSMNQLTGRIPAGLGFLYNLAVLDLSRNKLSGIIPSQLDGPFVFRYLSLSGNPGLCSDKPSSRFHSCRSGKNPSAKFVAMIASIAVILLVLSVLMTRYAFVYYRRKKYGLHTKWNFTAFQKLNFTESKVLPRLTENNVIGHGGSGMVYRVPVNRSGDFVAVKKISSKKDLDQRLEKEFLAEIEILSRIRHSNVVKLMGCISCDNSKLLVYEYMENRSLDRWLHRKQAPPSCGLNGSVRHVVLDWPTRLRISLGAARGLCYMHHDCVPGIVHRDVKSSNVLLDSEFNAKIADFGLARILAKENELNSMSTVAGSFGYMAPGRYLQLWSDLVRISNGELAALDNEVKEPMYLNEMTSVFELGLWCTSQLPTNRPSMKEVCRMLLVVAQPQARW
ncbi:putative transferase, protein kinase RLK-Pelle-LRR-XI-1 family [Helianthus debilis subsp. tardiflorus]